MALPNQGAPHLNIYGDPLTLDFSAITVLKRLVRDSQPNKSFRNEKSAKNRRPLHSMFIWLERFAFRIHMSDGYRVQIRLARLARRERPKKKHAHLFFIRF